MDNALALQRTFAASHPLLEDASPDALPGDDAYLPAKQRNFQWVSMLARLVSAGTGYGPGESTVDLESLDDDVDAFHWIDVHCERQLQVGLYTAGITSAPDGEATLVLTLGGSLKSLYKICCDGRYVR